MPQIYLYATLAIHNILASPCLSLSLTFDAQYQLCRPYLRAKALALAEGQTSLRAVPISLSGASASWQMA